MQDLLSDEKLIWQGEWNHIELNPEVILAQIFIVRPGCAANTILTISFREAYLWLIKISYLKIRHGGIRMR